MKRATICREAIEEVFDRENGVLTVDQVIQRIHDRYPERWKESTIKTYLRGLSVNLKAGLHSSGLREHAFLFSLGDRCYRRWDPVRDGMWEATEDGIQMFQFVEKEAAEDAMESKGKVAKPEVAEITLDPEQLETVRLGYQVAVELTNSRNETLWSQFNAFVTANSIILAGAFVALSTAQPAPMLSVGMPIVGLVLCGLWLVLYVRDVGFTEYYLRSAQELEELYLGDRVRTIQRGGRIADGESVKFKLVKDERQCRIGLIGRFVRARGVAYLTITVFAMMYSTIIVFGLIG